MHVICYLCNLSETLAAHFRWTNIYVFLLYLDLSYILYFFNKILFLGRYPEQVYAVADLFYSRITATTGLKRRLTPPFGSFAHSIYVLPLPRQLCFPQRFPHCKFNFSRVFELANYKRFHCSSCEPITNVVGIKGYPEVFYPGLSCIKELWSRDCRVTKKGRSLAYHLTELVSTHDFSRMLIVMSVKLILTNGILKVNSALKPVFSVIEDQCSGGQWSSKWGRQHFNTSSRQGGQTQFPRHKQCCVKVGSHRLLVKASAAIKKQLTANANVCFRTKWTWGTLEQPTKESRLMQRMHSCSKNWDWLPSQKLADFLRSSR